MPSNFWHVFDHAGFVEVSDSEGNSIRIDLCRNSTGKLGVVWEGAHPPNVGRLTADFGPTGHGFSSIEDARKHIDSHVA